MIQNARSESRVRKPTGSENGGDHLNRRIAGVRTMIATGNLAGDCLLSVEEVAKLLQVPVSWVYERTRNRGSNRIPGQFLR